MQLFFIKLLILTIIIYSFNNNNNNNNNNNFSKYGISLLKLKTNDLSVEYKVDGPATITGNNSGKKYNYDLILKSLFKNNIDDERLTEEEKDIFSHIFLFKCNINVFNFLVNLIGKIISLLKIYYCELKNLESSYKKCFHYGKIRKRLAGCPKIESKYLLASKTYNDLLSQFTMQKVKSISCISLITRISWRLGSHIYDQNNDSTIECVEQELIDAVMLLLMLDLFRESLVVAIEQLSEKVKCKCVSCPCLRSAKTRCIMKSIRDLSKVLASLKTSISERMFFIISCKGYLLNTKGSISNDDIKPTLEEIPEDLKNAILDKIRIL